ncbi:hypothetical protein HPB50_002134 [Hyalomma asiaticum]|uniref:Uncharacterized protein n=1 Tax=Hyalomma asiaticum TaxID=266040 RepID=A0ACB7RRJ0_HYAAI|nr:hypothetical protein HPB50_002134 [Hyalomma asiaticum]
MEPSTCRASNHVLDRCWIIPLVAACVTFTASLLESSKGYLYILYMENFSTDHGEASWPASVLSASVHLSGFALTLLQNKMSVFYMTLITIGACGAGATAGAFCPNIAWMTVAVGAIYGVGFGGTITCFSMYTLTYFDKYRATATAVKHASWSAAGLTGPSMLSVLYGYYGLHGALLLSGAFVIQSAPLALLLRRPRPLNIWRRKCGTKYISVVSSKLPKPGPRIERNSETLSSRSSPTSPAPLAPDTRLCISLSLKNLCALFGKPELYVLVTLLATFEWSTSLHGTTAADYGRAKGAPLEEAKHVLTVGAFGYLVGRTVVPFAADRIQFSRVPLAVAALVTSLLSFIAPSVIASFQCFVALNMLLGICQGYVSCIRTVLISEYLGVQCLAVTNGSHLNRKCCKVSKNLHQPPDATRPVAAAAAAAHSPLETVPPLFHHSKPATARTTAVTGPDLAPGAQDPAQLIAEAADLARTHVDRDPVQPYELLQDPVRLARAPEQYLRR